MKTYLDILFFCPSIWIMLSYRVARIFRFLRLSFIALLIMHIVKIFTGVEIHPNARIGKNLFIDHGVGTVIGETAVIGDNCIIYHNVTLGAVSFKTTKRHPTIGNNVMIGAGAKILGNIYIGDNVKIGANATVLNNIESLNTVVGCKGKVVKK